MCPHLPQTLLCYEMYGETLTRGHGAPLRLVVPTKLGYNPLQKLAYTTAIGLGGALAVTGLALYKPVQLSWLVAALGGFRLTRIWHFTAMCGLLGFIPGHLVMVAIHGWSNFASMWTGSKVSTS